MNDREKFDALKGRMGKTRAAECPNCHTKAHWHLRNTSIKPKCIADLLGLLTNGKPAA